MTKVFHFLFIQIRYQGNSKNYLSSIRSMILFEIPCALELSFFLEVGRTEKRNRIGEIRSGNEFHLFMIISTFLRSYLGTYLLLHFLSGPEILGTIYIHCFLCLISLPKILPFSARRGVERHLVSYPEKHFLCLIDRASKVGTEAKDLLCVCFMNESDATSKGSE